MAYKLIDAAQARWRAVNAPHLVALVRAGAVFHKGKLLERPIDITPAEPANQPKRRSPETPRSTGLDNFSKFADYIDFRTENPSDDIMTHLNREFTDETGIHDT